MENQWETSPFDPNISQKLPKVAILICTHNGQRFLAEQLDSIAEQSHRNWEVLASDDGSSDDTRHILDSFKAKWGGKLSVFDGPKKGHAENFFSLFVKTKCRANYFAFADQDDVWEKNKLSRAVAMMEMTSLDVPELYCSRTIYTDEFGIKIGYSTLFKKPASFRNALVQNIAAGNTMVMNHLAWDLVARNVHIVTPPFHDWWIYLFVIGSGGRVIYDPHPGVLYRQHGGNIVGENVSFPAILHRARGLLCGKFKGWVELNMRALKSVQKELTQENRMILDAFILARKEPRFFQRMRSFRRVGVYRQTFLGNLGLFVGALLNRI